MGSAPPSIDIDKVGGVLYRDNEIVLNSLKMAKVSETHGLDDKNSIEYTPTGNSGAESAFRILPHEMRKSMIRAGTPDPFWASAAVDAAELLESRQESYGSS